MGIQKYRADRKEEPDAQGVTCWYCDWLGGPTLAKLENCPTDEDILGRRMVWPTGEPDTFFSIPAACQYKGRRITGFLTCEDRVWKFNMYTSQRPKLRD